MKPSIVGGNRPNIRVYQGIKQDVLMIVDDIMEALIAEEPPTIQREQSQDEPSQDGENQPNQDIGEKSWYLKHESLSF